ncbi:hypothetical protein LCGC14_1009050 [marine sediment metagenome]|uniref:Uncharacterized protein n=1 Tax=marine sediment metagenome TaxID=412755 RepID=A0A0F9NM73_9ZZZZ
MSEPRLTAIIKDYLSDTELKETLHDQKLDLGFRFIFPKGKNPQGIAVGKPFTIVKAKKRRVLEISSSITLTGEPLKSWMKMNIKTRQDGYLGTF